MQYTTLGRSGLTVSRLCLGCMSFGKPGKGPHRWTLDEAQTRPLLRQAVELGINFFDTANAYADGTSEEILGDVLKDYIHRDELVLATKLYAPWRGGPNVGGLSRKAVFESVDASLKRLGMDTIDLYQIHRWDYATPIEETMEALHDVVRSGRVRYIGASSMFSWQLLKANVIAEKHGWTKFISMQNHLNLLYREEEREMLPLCAEEGIGVIPWSPLARGRLTRDWDEKTERSETDVFGKMIYAATAENDRRIVEAVAELSRDIGVPRAQVALAWLLAKSEVSAPIVGATKSHHLTDAAAALDVKLSAENITQLEKYYLPHPVVGLMGPRPFQGRTTLKDAP